MSLPNQVGGDGAKTSSPNVMPGYTGHLYPVIVLAHTNDYGHGKFETLARLFIGLALVVAAIGIIVSGSVKFAHWLEGDKLVTIHIESRK